MFTINQGTISGNISNFYNEDGRLTNEPTPIYNDRTGGCRLKLSLAHNKSVKDNNGNWKDEPHFFEFTIFGKTAEYLSNNLVKGQQVTISYSLVQEKWQDKDGGNKSKVGFRVEALVPGKAPKGRPDAQDSVPDTDQIPF